MKLESHILRTVATLLAAVILLSPVSCKKFDQAESDPQLVRKVLLLYADGYNNLPAYMAGDIEDLKEMAPKDYLRDRYSILVMKHFAVNEDYTTPTKPVLLELYKDNEGNPKADTIKVYPDSTVTSSVETMRTVLSDVKALYPSAEYGMIYSSHGTGWIPEEYYNKYSASTFAAVDADGHQITGRIDLLSIPEFKSMGCHGYYERYVLRSKEIDVRELQKAFPMHLKYLILDACLMGGIETAFQLRDVVDNIIFSACEVPGGGFDYLNLPDRVLYPEQPDFKAVCDDYLKLYNNCTAALVNCKELGGLAEVCKTIFSEYKSQIADVTGNMVQPFFRGNHPWYYDLRNILKRAGVSEERMSEFDRALERCIEYKVYSNYFYTLKLNTYCGLSTYLPSMGDEELDEFYKGYDWNVQTGFVK